MQHGLSETDRIKTKTPTKRRRTNYLALRTPFQWYLRSFWYCQILFLTYFDLPTENCFKKNVPPPIFFWCIRTEKKELLWFLSLHSIFQKEMYGCIAHAEHNDSRDFSSNKQEIRWFTNLNHQRCAEFRLRKKVWVTNHFVAFVHLSSVSVWIFTLCMWFFLLYRFCTAIWSN